MGKCLDRLKDIAKDNFTDDELREVLKDAQHELAERENLADLSGTPLQDTIKSNTDKLKQSIDQAQFTLNLEELQVARSAALFKNFTKFKIDPLKKFAQSLTLGTRFRTAGAAARTLVTHLTKRRMNGRVYLKNAIESVKDGMQVLKSSEYEVPILRAINGEEGNNKIANQIGKAIAKFRKATLKEMERHGIVVAKLENRGIYQTHRAELLLQTADTLAERTKLRLLNIKEFNKAQTYKKLAFNRWRDFIDNLLDLKKTFGEFTAENEEDRNEIYREIFDNITSDATSLGKKSIQSQVDTSRFFHFKNEESQLTYNNKYGSGTLFDSLMGEADTSWGRIGTLEFAGNRPLNYIEKVIRLVAKQQKGRFTKAEVTTKVDEARYLMQQTLGISSTVQGMSGKLVKAIQLALFAKIAPTLGPLVAIADIAPAIHVLSQLGGRGLIRSAIKVFDIGRRIRSEEENLLKFSNAMGFRRDIQLGSIHKWSGVDNSALRGKLATLMMKLSPHEFMNYVEGLSTAHELTLMLGQNSKVAFDNLPIQLSKALNLYGIEADRWNLLRKGTTKIGDYTHITSDALRNISKEDIKKFIKKKFNLEKVSDFRVEQEREQTQQLFTQMITDKMSTASNLTDARQRSFWSFNFNLNTDGGRKWANLFSIIGSLRYYETTIVHRTLAPLIYGESGESVMGSIIGGHMDKMGLARWAALSFTLSALAFSIQDLMRGETPRPEQILMRSALAPLGAIGEGFQVDSGYNHNALNTVLGPGPMLLFDSIDDIGKVMRFDHPVKNATNFVTTAIPGFNNSLSRKAIHHLMQDQFGSMYGRQ